MNNHLLTAYMLERACCEFLTWGEQTIINAAKNEAGPKFQALMRDAVVGKPITLQAFAQEALRCAKLALRPEPLS